MDENFLDVVRQRIGHVVGVSPWLQISQDMIDGFAELSGDRQFIHLDKARASRLPFGDTIAHGMFILSLIPRLAESATFLIAGSTMTLNYGFNRVRMLSPVRCDKRIQCRFVLRQITERKPNQWLTLVDVQIDIDGETKPAILAEWLVLQILESA